MRVNHSWKLRLRSCFWAEWIYVPNLIKIGRVIKALWWTQALKWAKREELNWGACAFTTSGVIGHRVSGCVYGLTSHSTHYRSSRGRFFTGQMTKPTVSKHCRLWTLCHTMHHRVVLITIIRMLSSGGQGRSQMCDLHFKFEEDRTIGISLRTHRQTYIHSSDCISVDCIWQTKTTGENWWE